MLLFASSIFQRYRAANSLLALAIALLSAAAPLTAQAADKRVYPGYIVSLKPAGANAAVAYDSQALAQHGVSVSKNLGSNQMLVLAGAAMMAMDQSSAEAVPYDPNKDLCPKLLASGSVESCSPNYEVRASALPNDPSMSSLWGLSSSLGIDAPGAWDTSTGSSEVVVAVIDTGVDYTHPDLSANMWSNPYEVAGNGIDDDGNGIIDDVHGANFSHESNSQNNLPKGDPRDNNMHGTHVAGTIGAVGDNSRGVTGINWNVKIMALKFLNSNGAGSLADAILAINYVVAMKNRGINVRVANNSWGGGGYSGALMNAIKAARDAGVLFIAAAGNEANDNDASPAYPASYEVSNVVSVAAIDSEQNLASFSNYGRSKVDIAAPGVGILSTVPGNSYASLSGTSMATPHVAGALALLFAAEPNLSNDEALSRMYDSALPESSLQDIVRTGRKLNLKRMLQGTIEPVPPPTPEPLPCHYAIEEIQFNPDQQVAAQPIVLQADEMSFHNLELPFQFPFYRSTVTSLQVSPNGVVYRKAPSGMDYTNSSRAPLNSIAPLQTDLLAADGSTDGVHVLKSSDRVVVYWDMKFYDSPAGGNVRVWLHLYADGIIEQFLSFGSDELLAQVRKQATVGMSGPTRESADTYAVNSKKITNGLSLRYTPQCGEGQGDNAQVRRISVKPSKGNSIVPGGKVGIRFGGSGYGTVLVSAAFNGQVCQAQVSGYMTDGRLRMAARLPRKSFDRFAVMADGKQAKMKMAKSSRRAARSKRLNSEQLESLCSRFFATLK